MAELVQTQIHVTPKFICLTIVLCCLLILKRKLLVQDGHWYQIINNCLRPSSDTVAKDTNTHTHTYIDRHIFGLPWWLSGKESICQHRRLGFSPGVTKIPWKRKWQPTPVFLPGESHGQRSLAGYSPWITKSWTRLATKWQLYVQHIFIYIHSICGITSVVTEWVHWTSQFFCHFWSCQGLVCFTCFLIEVELIYNVSGI